MAFEPTGFELKWQKHLKVANWTPGLLTHPSFFTSRPGWAAVSTSVVWGSSLSGASVVSRLLLPLAAGVFPGTPSPGQP